jgi:hypothetical protein
MDVYLALLTRALAGLPTAQAAVRHAGRTGPSRRS